MGSRTRYAALGAAALFALAGLCRAQTITRLEQNDPAVTYSGTWDTNNSSSNSGSLAALANNLDSIAALTFNGTGITWIGVKDPGAGMAWVNVDGTTTVVDTYASSTLYQQPLFSVYGLQPGRHTIFINVPQTPDPAGTGSWVWIDAFDIDNGSAVTGETIASASRIDAGSSALLVSGTWSFSSENSSTAGSRVTAYFNGTSIVWITSYFARGGIANVYVDGALKATVDTYTPTTSDIQAPGYGIGGLSPGVHTMTIEVTGNQNPSSTGNLVWVYGFQITGVPAFAGPPAVNSGGVVNGASFQAAPNNQVTPGQIISIFGQRFLMSGRADAASTPLPQTLGPNNTAVSACGQSLPLFNAFPTQINAQLPWECPATGSVPLTVTVNGQSSTTEAIHLAPASPAIFQVSLDNNDFLQVVGAVLHTRDYSIVSEFNAAKPGETVAIFCTGLGATTDPLTTGVPAAAASQTLNRVTVTIGGLDAPVSYSGIAPGYVGLYQVNVTVPAFTVHTAAVVISEGGATSPIVYTVVVPQ